MFSDLVFKQYGLFDSCGDLGQPRDDEYTKIMDMGLHGIVRWDVRNVTRFADVQETSQLCVLVYEKGSLVCFRSNSSVYLTGV